MHALYRGHQAHLTDETSEDANTGPRLDFGDGLTFRVRWGDPRLTVDPTDDEWTAARPLLPRLPGLVDLPDGTTAAVLFRA